MRVLVVSQYFWPENFRINDLVLGLRERGNKVEILTGVPNYPKGSFFEGYTAINKIEDEYNGIIVHRAPLILRGKGGGVRLGLNFLSFAFTSSVLAPFFCRGKYDIIFVYEPSPITVGLPALVLRKVKFAPVIFWMQDLWPESLSATGAIQSKFILKLVEILVRFIYKGCDRILVQSNAFVPSIIRLGGRPNKIYYYPNSAEALYRPVKPEPDATEHSLLPKGFRVTFAGNIGVAQDFPTILAAAERLKDHHEIHWVIIGDGRMFDWVKSEIRTRGLSKTVHLLGRYPAEAMPHFFALSEALMVTLKKEPIFALTIPSKVQSYLACAKPIIAALDGEGARIIEESGAGVICLAEDSNALADAVLKLYHMSATDRKEMGRRGRRYFEKNFEREMLLDRLEGWMKEIISNKKVKRQTI